MQFQVQLAVLACALSLAACTQDLSATYPFKATLNTAENGGLYELYWTFDNAAENISFAVRVQTTGWVGFGISPNGQMPNSDVVIGWVDNGQTFFHDRFATSRSPPSVDEQQDWTLVDGEEEGGFTVLEFTRKYITCDNKDLPITSETARVIWSFHPTADPTSENVTFSQIHSYKGSASLNLLGGLPSAAPDPDDLQYYDIKVDRITIPDDDTTYWCAVHQLPEDIRKQTRYITKFSPIVTEGNAAHVHHLIVYLCTGLNDTHVGTGGECMEGVGDEVAECRGGLIIAAWAVGGEDFVYPNNVAYPFGGEGEPQYLLIELHYDNPEMISGVIDSSGIRFWYTNTPQDSDAGILPIGYHIHRSMIIPPHAKNFTVTSFINENCTDRFFPEGGIHVFANILHTHVVGHGLTVQHLRHNSECDVYEELEPIDRNLQYDFNYQQINHLTREVTVLPGDVIQLKCFYGTEQTDGVTTGGFSTREEMCFTFLVYYPRIEMSLGLSVITEDDLLKYLGTLPAHSVAQISNGQYVEGLNSVDWDEERRQTLENVFHNSTQNVVCSSEKDGVFATAKLPEVGCSYIASDQCTDFTPPSCCERINGIADDKTENEDDINNDDDNKDDDNESDNNGDEDDDSDNKSEGDKGDDKDIIGNNTGEIVMGSMALLLVLSVPAALL